MTLTKEYSSTTGKVLVKRRRRLGQMSEELKKELESLSKFELTRMRIANSMNRLNIAQ